VRVRAALRLPAVSGKAPTVAKSGASGDDEGGVDGGAVVPKSKIGDGGGELGIH